MSEIMPGQIEIDGYLVGRGTNVIVSEFSPGGLPARTTNDRPLYGADGRIFGKEVIGGRTIGLGLTVDLDNVFEAAEVYADLARVWNAAQVRAEDGAYIEMRVRRFALPTVVCYGRPRRFDPANEELLERGRVDIVADFETIDPYFYTDIEAVRPVTVSISPPETGGFSAPFPGPIIVATTAEGFGEFVVEGHEPTPLVTRIEGPISQPVLDLVGGWRAQLLVNIPYDGHVDIDPRPWARTVLGSNGEELSGFFSSDSPPISDLQLLPGRNELVLRGQDPTGTASATLTWQGRSTVPYWR